MCLTIKITLYTIMKKLFVSAVVIALAWLCTSASVNAQVVVKVRPVAPVVVAVRPAAPAPDYVWVDGEWVYYKNRGYVWKEGYWLKPRAGYAWTPGRWVVVRGGHRWVAGCWKPSSRKVVVVRRKHHYHGRGRK